MCEYGPGRDGRAPCTKLKGSATLDGASVTLTGAVLSLTIMDSSTLKPVLHKLTAASEAEAHAWLKKVHTALKIEEPPEEGTVLIEAAVPAAPSTTDQPTRVCARGGGSPPSYTHTQHTLPCPSHPRAVPFIACRCC